ncbi:hypothetical protein [Hyalangium gracile]|uniref:hypothetical protein n=1 Tax=Hyalangium gracile TaxID=394092 RepID=UPI001CCCB52D|nr:hypothetical protein [Hyalangium gracile]
MSRGSSVFLALLLLTSSAAPARDKAPPKPDVSSDMPADFQLIGWSKDEKRFAVRRYDLSDSEDDLSEPPPYCPGYVNHLGKKFRGGLLLQLYEGTTATKTWGIQDSEPCTPPETARERLTQAKAALAEQGVDLLAVGAVVMPRKGARKATPRGNSKLAVGTATTTLVLPSGPWARQTVDVTCRVERRDSGKSEEDGIGTYLSRATFTVRLRTGKKPVALGEFTLGPTEWSPVMAGRWDPTFDRLFLSPSGKSFVLLARLDEGNMHDSSVSSVVLGLVALPERPGSASPAR